MIRLRIFVPRGTGQGAARLQALVPGPPSALVRGTREPAWQDVPTVYEDPDDEVIECPVDLDRHRGPDRICVVCLGEGSARRGDIVRRLDHVDAATLRSIKRPDKEIAP